MFKHIMEVSKIVAPRTVKDVLCHTMEEVGEIATMINKPHAEYDETLTHEIADAILCLVDLQYVHTLNQNPELSGQTDVMASWAEMGLVRALKQKAEKWKKFY